MKSGIKLDSGYSLNSPSLTKITRPMRSFERSFGSSGIMWPSPFSKQVSSSQREENGRL
jgi:hypothetical protein